MNKIFTNFAADNLHVKNDSLGNTILTGGVIGRVKDHFMLVEKSKNSGKITQEKDLMFGAIKMKIPKNFNFSDAEEIKKLENKVEILVMQDKFKGVSSGFEHGQKTYVSSWGDDGMLVCKTR